MPPGTSQSGSLNNVANFLHPVVAGRIKLENVVTGAQFHCFAGIAYTAGLAIDRVLAVEHFGQNARCGGLSGATWP